MNTADNKSKFKPGDKVVRVNQNNGPDAAQVGQVAIVVGFTQINESNAMVHVVYEGCKTYGFGPFPECEGWYVENVALYVDPKGPIEWENSEFVSEGYVDGFKFADIRRPWGPCGRIRYPYWVLKTQLPYGGWSTVGQFKTLEAAKEFAETEAVDLKALGKFQAGMK